MKLLEALELLKQPVSSDGPPLKVFLACGFTPLHLQTFLEAELRTRFLPRRVETKVGLFGDLAGNIERLPSDTYDALAVVVEWGDLDPRLGIRSLGGWRPSNLPDTVDSAEQSAARLLRVLGRVSRAVPTVVSMPTLPLPPLFWTSPGRAASLELKLHHIVASLAKSLSEQLGIQIANPQLLGEVSPPSQRFDVRSEVNAGFPYRLPHASALAGQLAGLIENKPPKKGLITDLDDTLWAGILGDDGVNGISWHLERGTHMHGLYQQFAASLAGAGVLMGVASKNDPALVEQAFDRSDLLISRSDIFPFEVHWRPKSESVRRILGAWNVAADSVVFIDDSPMEVAEVKAAFPEMECVVFPKSDSQGILDLLGRLRGVFGKPFLTEDDGLRLDSIRNNSKWRESVESAGNAADDFLRSAEACIAFTVTRDSGDARAFELLNKTNQFNLNGQRLTESEWRVFCSDSNAILLTASYKDKFGQLGTVAVMLGKTNGRRLHLSAWVISCRAFSRRVEHHCLRYLFDALDVDEIVFDYKATPRNGPLQEFFTALVGAPAVPGFSLSREQFGRRVPALFHRVEETTNV